MTNKYFILDDINEGENSLELQESDNFLLFNLTDYKNKISYSDKDNIQSSYKINDSKSLHIQINLINDEGVPINAITLRNLEPFHILTVDNTKMYFYKLSEFISEMYSQAEDLMTMIKEDEEEDLSEEREFYGRYFNFQGDEIFSILDIEEDEEDFDIDAEQLGGGYSVIVDHAINGQAQIMGYDDYQPPIFKGELTEQQGSGYFADLGADNVGGQMVISGYDDNNPPVFTQEGGDLKLLDKKIQHITNYIIKRGDYKLPKYILNDIEKLEQ